VFCVPDDYEVLDRQLDDVKYNLDPRYTTDLLALFSREQMLGRSLEGSEFIPGFVGLNNLKNTAFANVVL
jgi:U4/U6.U5 tri-snRNP-associated protein 2